VGRKGLIPLSYLFFTETRDFLPGTFLVSASSVRSFSISVELMGFFNGLQYGAEIKKSKQVLFATRVLKRDINARI
jgi:hypothetical protein